jgi:hypothetical protein
LEARGYGSKGNARSPGPDAGEQPDAYAGRHRARTTPPPPRPMTNFTGPKQEKSFEENLSVYYNATDFANLILYLIRFAYVFTSLLVDSFIEGILGFI